jgi:hypothetical protein
MLEDILGFIDSKSRTFLLYIEEARANLLRKGGIWPQLSYSIIRNAM